MQIIDNMDLLICSSTESVVDAMKRIDRNAYGMLYIVDEENHLVGCVTDGDIRRWIIKGGKLGVSVDNAMNPAPICILKNNRDDAKRIMIEKQVRSVAVVDDEKHIIDIVFLTKKESTGKDIGLFTDTDVIIMAGGKGTRLYPYTKILPKPLIPIGEIPILERILERFEQYGVSRFYLTVNYRKEMIKSYFKELSHHYDIRYIEEEKPLGTAGSIRLITERLSNPVIVTNCDILIEADYNDIVSYHKESGNDMTIVSSLKNTIIPYGVIYAKENGIITSMEEKPELSHFINTGMYILNPLYIDMIPQMKMFHMPQLAEEMIKENRKVGMYPISENSFLDMGEFAEMKRMEERINVGFVDK